jgi:hypothetical protein
MKEQFFNTYFNNYQNLQDETGNESDFIYCEFINKNVKKICMLSIEYVYSKDEIDCLYIKGKIDALLEHIEREKLIK